MIVVPPPNTAAADCAIPLLEIHISPLLSKAIPDGPLNWGEVIASTGASLFVPVWVSCSAVKPSTVLLSRSVIQALPTESITACCGVLRDADVMVAIGSGALSVARAASYAALNSNSAGVAAPLTMPCGSSTHRLPSGSNATPCGVPKTALLIDTCGGVAPVPPPNWAGLYSTTFVPLATHSPRPPTVTPSSLGKLQAPSSPVARTAGSNKVRTLQSVLRFTTELIGHSCE